MMKESENLILMILKLNALVESTGEEKAKAHIYLFMKDKKNQTLDFLSEKKKKNLLL